MPITTGSLQRLAAMLLICRAAHGWAAFDGYLELGDVKGESTDSRHKDWIEVQAFSGGVLQTNGFAGGGAGARAIHADLVLLKALDRSSPAVALACAQGARFKKATLECVRVDGNRARFYSIELSDVTIRSVAMSASGSAERPLEETGLSYDRIAWTYTEFDVKGMPKGDTSAYWDVARGQGGSGVPRPVFRVSAKAHKDKKMGLSWAGEAGKTYLIRSSATLNGVYESFMRVTAGQDGSCSAEVQVLDNARFFLVELTN